MRATAKIISYKSMGLLTKSCSVVIPLDKDKPVHWCLEISYIPKNCIIQTVTTSRLEILPNNVYCIACPSSTSWAKSLQNATKSKLGFSSTPQLQWYHKMSRKLWVIRCCWVTQRQISMHLSPVQFLKKAPEWRSFLISSKLCYLAGPPLRLVL